MKKVFLLLLVIALSLGTLSAQMTSIEDETTYGLFNNALDAAATIDESATDLDFSKLGKDYLFAGVAGNPQGIPNRGSASYFSLGYYKAAEKPWSIFTNISWTGTGNQTGEVSDGENVTTKYNYRLFDTFNPSAQFLINLGGFSTGLGLGVYLEDKDLPNNYKMTNSATNTTTEMKDKDFRTNASLFVPFYMEKGNLSHYAKLNVGLTIFDKSSSNYVTTNGTATVDNETKDIATTISPSVLYKLSMPTEKLGTFYGSGEIGLTTKSYKNENVGNVEPKSSSSHKASYAPGFNAALTAGLRMEQSTDGDWLRFRLNPEATYSFNSKSYQTGSTSSTTFGGTTTTATEVGGKDQGISNSLTLSLKSAMEVKPEKWIVGLMLGAEGNVGFTNTTQTKRVAKPSDQEADKPTNKTVTNGWEADASSSFGLFIPLPNGYRFDVSVLSGENLLIPASLRMQLIVPLGKTTGF